MWASSTESDRTALWFGPWKLLLENMIRVQMAFEEGTPAATGFDDYYPAQAEYYFSLSPR